MCAAGCTPGASCPIGDLHQAAALEIVHFDENYDEITTSDHARVPLRAALQGGWVAVLGARATNLDGCRVDLTSSFRDPDSTQIMKVDRRPTTLDDAGDGWAITPPALAAELQFCPHGPATRDLDDEPYEITVALADAYGHAATQSIVIVPVCSDPLCTCQCARDYVVGSACP